MGLVFSECRFFMLWVSSSIYVIVHSPNVQKVSYVLLKHKSKQLSDAFQERELEEVCLCHVT